MSDLVRPGATNSLVDVAGLRVGHATRTGEGWLSGTTVVLTGADGAVGGVDVRGGGPGTRETDLLDPRNAVERVHAVMLTGGSAFGLAAATGVMSRLVDAGIGFSVGPPGHVVPIVPGAVIFDLGRGGDFRATPDGDLGAEAYDAAVASGGAAPASGAVGAGTGAVAGGLKGGIGSASAVLPDGSTVAALLVVNAAGSTVDRRTGELLGAVVAHLLRGH
ncbi:MAG: P1 family peptidase [Actinomycetales bacterium]